jgi:hypothetical protein
VVLSLSASSLPGQKHSKSFWAAVGHNSVYTFDGKDYIVYHGYDAKDNGKPKLIIRELNWNAAGWPVIAP